MDKPTTYPSATLGIYLLSHRDYHVTASHPDLGEADQVLEAVSLGHAQRMLLVDFLGVWQWPEELQNCFWVAEMEGIRSMVPGLEFGGSPLGPEGARA